MGIHTQIFKVCIAMLQITYVVFMVLFARVLLTDLAPFHGISHVTYTEWILIVYEISFTAEELKQVR